MLFRSTLVWTCQIPIGFYISNTSFASYITASRLMAILELMPISVFLFSLQYFKVLNTMHTHSKCTHRFFTITCIVSYVCAFITVFLLCYIISPHFNYYPYKASTVQFYIEISLGLFAIFYLIASLVLVQKLCASFSLSGSKVDSEGMIVTKKL